MFSLCNKLKHIFYLIFSEKSQHAHQAISRYSLQETALPENLVETDLNSFTPTADLYLVQNNDWKSTSKILSVERMKVYGLVCVECGIRLTSLDSWKEHYQIYHSYKAFCMPCRKPFKTQQGYNYHQSMHEGGWSCDTCGKIVQSETHLKRHKRIHSGEKSFGCPNCGKGFRHNFQMTSHMKICHPLD